MYYGFEETNEGLVLCINISVYGKHIQCNLVWIAEISVLTEASQKVQYELFPFKLSIAGPISIP